MSVRNKIAVNDGVFFITFTCARWLPLFEMVNGYGAVYKWFDYLREKGHHIVAYVIMPNHVHVVIGFCRSSTSINTIIANGKRFMAYALVKQLELHGRKEILEQMASWVNATDAKRNKKHEVFEPSFDRKESFNLAFTRQKVNYIHNNPCKAGLAKLPEDYLHSSARYYFHGKHSAYPVITYMELQDVDLTVPAESLDRGLGAHRGGPAAVPHAGDTAETVASPTSLSIVSPPSLSIEDSARTAEGQPQCPHSGDTAQTSHDGWCAMV